VGIIFSEFDDTKTNHSNLNLSLRGCRRLFDPSYVLETGHHRHAAIVCIAIQAREAEQVNDHRILGICTLWEQASGDSKTAVEAIASELKGNI
jgi:hypothetical protein